MLTMPIFKPLSMDFFSITSLLYKSIGIWALCYVFLRFIKKNQKPSVLTILMMVLEGVTFTSTILHKGSLDNVFWSASSLIYVAILIDLCIKENKSETLIRCMMVHLELCTYINLLTVLIKPNGFFSRTISAYGKTEEWFLGSDHYFVVWAIPAFLIAWIYKEYSRKKYRSYILCITTILTQFIKGSATGVVGVSIFLLWMILPLIKKIMTPLKSVILAGALFVTIIFMRVANFLEPIIVGVLGKDMTFTSRLGIWNNAITAIKKSQLIGYGIQYSSQTVEMLGNLNGFLWMGATHCHNQFLQVAFQSGLIGIVCYVSMILISFMQCKKYSKLPITQVGTVCLFVFCIISITEVYEYQQLYLLFILPYYWGDIAKAINLIGEA